MLVGLVGVLSSAGGCNLLIPWIFVGEHKVKIPPEFDKLRGKRVAMVIWADPATLFDYPHVRLELAAYTGDLVSGHVKKVDVVDPFSVEEYLDQHPDMVIAPRKVGSHFDADMVVYIELLEFQMRDPTAPDLLRGQVKASVSVLDLRAEPDEVDQYTLDSVNIIYPEGRPVLMTSRSAQLVRQHTYEQFAEKVSRKFHEYKVDQ